ncbi:MAG: hypothetical protein PHI40_00310 [Caldisericia bacterium]|jgi:hypothetical protein|nr:hypothetical protein [Caldisericia bacterium]
MISGDGILTITTRIRRKDGRIEEEAEDYEVKDGKVIQHGNAA